MPADRADGVTFTTSTPGAPSVPAPIVPAPAAPAPAFVMVGTDDAGLCVDGVCALPPTGAADVD